MLKLKKEGLIDDFRIQLNINSSILLYVLRNLHHKNYTIDLSDNRLSNDIIITYYDDINDLMEDTFVNELFQNQNLINVSSSQRHLSNLLNPIEQVNNTVPVVTFYSYKGGVGRSTALASCASYLSIKKHKKIVILDCDFEAPGFTNFYLEEPSCSFHKNGLVEYFLDSESEDVSLNNYYWEVSKKFTGNGSIYIFPAGNLDDSEKCGDTFTTHRNHYLNGLTRLDVFSNNVLVKQFKSLLTEIQSKLNPDLVLIDSRTGFNDIFGISAFRLSDVVVGFFGSNAQTRPGLDFFLDTLLQEKAPHLIVANSIIPLANKRKWFASFVEYVDSYLARISGESLLKVPMYPIPYNDVLNNIGTKQEDYLDFIDLIEKNGVPEFDELFGYINAFIDNFNNKVEDCQEDKKPILTKSIERVETMSEAFQLKHQILLNLSEKMPQLYAENITDFENEYKENRYFYRSCMEDLFNQDKLLVLGNKGTGKSYIYKSLKNSHIVQTLQNRANKVDFQYNFLPIIDNNKRFDTIKLDHIIAENDDTELFFERFWTVYIWNAVMLERPFGYQSDLEVEVIRDDNETGKRFLKYIGNVELMIQIENDLRKLDEYLVEKKNKQLIIIFDELDNIVKPYKWSEKISPLINLCKKMNYASIFPKLFLRSDLFEKISNINNKKELSNRSISIEWNREELFAYFFKLVLSHSKEEFVKLTKLYAYYPSSYLNKTIKTIEKCGNQPPVDDYTLRHMSSTFFGKYADVKNTPRYGESYDWFFVNLKNANNTISLRPFIDLLSISVNRALKEDKSDCPILPQYYYTHGQARFQAVENHFRDLAEEKGNEDLIPIFEFIRDKASYKYKKEQLTQNEFFSLLDMIIQSCDLKENNTRDSIISLLEVNGIIRSIFVRVGHNPHKNYQFALLYKYYLGLKSKKHKVY